jgi:hypothetical protein
MLIRSTAIRKTKIPIMNSALATTPLEKPFPETPMPGYPYLVYGLLVYCHEYVRVPDSQSSNTTFDNIKPQTIRSPHATRSPSRSPEVPVRALLCMRPGRLAHPLYPVDEVRAERAGTRQRCDRLASAASCLTALQDDTIVMVPSLERQIPSAIVHFCRTVDRTECALVFKRGT